MTKEEKLFILHWMLDSCQSKGIIESGEVSLDVWKSGEMWEFAKKVIQDAKENLQKEQQTSSYVGILYVRKTKTGDQKWMTTQSR